VALLFTGAPKVAREGVRVLEDYLLRWHHLKSILSVKLLLRSIALLTVLGQLVHEVLERALLISKFREETATVLQLDIAALLNVAV